MSTNYEWVAGADVRVATYVTSDGSIGHFGDEEIEAPYVVTIASWDEAGIAIEVTSADEITRIIDGLKFAHRVITRDQRKGK